MTKYLKAIILSVLLGFVVNRLGGNIDVLWELGVYLKCILFTTGLFVLLVVIEKKLVKKESLVNPKLRYGTYLSTYILYVAAYAFVYANIRMIHWIIRDKILFQDFFYEYFMNVFLISRILFIETFALGIIGLVLYFVCLNIEGKIKLRKFQKKQL